MKKGIHPDNYRLVAFKDMSNNDVFITKSAVETKDTIKHDGVDYPLVKLEISRTSHPYYTGPRCLNFLDISKSWGLRISRGRSTCNKRR